MLIQANDNLIGESFSQTCGFHKKNPGMPYAGCTCTGGYTLREMTAEEKAKRDAERQQKTEESERSELARLKAKYEPPATTAESADGERAPEDAILFCPKCKTQHIDKAEPDKCQECGGDEFSHFDIDENGKQRDGTSCGHTTTCDCTRFVAWLNPPHKKHRCHNCNHVWKPLNIPTNGVKELEENAADR